jgi:hypothetical protein
LGYFTEDVCLGQDIKTSHPLPERMQEASFKGYPLTLVLWAACYGPVLITLFRASLPFFPPLPQAFLTSFFDTFSFVLSLHDLSVSCFLAVFVIFIFLPPVFSFSPFLEGRSQIISPWFSP